jgi:hypothetical protein
VQRLNAEYIDYAYGIGAEDAEDGSGAPVIGAPKAISPVIVAKAISPVHRREVQDQPEGGSHRREVQDQSQPPRPDASRSRSPRRA